MNTFNNKDSSPPQKTSKIESLEANKNNISYVITEVIEKIKQTIENDISVQSIPKTMLENKLSNIPVPEISIETVVEKVIKPDKIKSSPEQNVKNLEETKPCENIKLIKNLQPSSEKHCKSQLVDKSLSKPKSSFKQKQKIPKNEPKFKERNSLFKYGNYNR